MCVCIYTHTHARAQTQDVNTSPPIMYILKELLTFLVRFGLSIGARKTLGERFGDENSFNSTSVELSYVKLAKDGTLRVNAALCTISRKLPLTIRLGLDLEQGGRCIIVRQPQLVTTGIFGQVYMHPHTHTHAHTHTHTHTHTRTHTHTHTCTYTCTYAYTYAYIQEVYVPFMPLAKSGADLGPDLHLSKLLVREGVIEAEGIVIIRPPTSLTVEQAQKSQKSSL